MVKVYGIKNCDSVRKAVGFLDAHHIPYGFTDIRETPVDLEKIEAWLHYTDLKTLFNTRSATYRTLKLKEMQLDDETKKAWLAKENMLIKRPVVELENGLLIGYNEAVYQDTLL